jgi:hypothetical protein
MPTIISTTIAAPQVVKFGKNVIVSLLIVMKVFDQNGVGQQRLIFRSTQLLHFCQAAVTQTPPESPGKKFPGLHTKWNGATSALGDISFATNKAFIAKRTNCFRRGCGFH